MTLTNKVWYPYKEFGSYYKLENGILLFAPMNSDGSIDKDINGEVNWGEVEYIEEEDKMRMAEIKFELKRKI